jgi:microsomal dipeptidase-like Zn-dependent dipeptidase
MAAPPIGAQTLFDFESGDSLDSWKATGAAFQHAVVRAADVFTTSRVLDFKKIGGAYWQNLAYPVGQHGDRLISTILKAPGSTGTITSRPILLDHQNLEFSARIGGTAGVEQRLELYVGNRAIFTATNDGFETLRQATFTIPPALAGQPAYIKIVDNDPKGHVNVDFIGFTHDKALYRPPVWGLGDIHTHLFSNLAFGHFKGADVMWGQPGGAYTSYLLKDGYLSEPCIGKDLKKCIPRHGGGFTTEAFINTVEERHPDADKPWKTPLQFLTHGRYGDPGFKNFPGFLSSSHQQMHITQIHRAWEGGLRLMVQLGVNNKAVDYVASKVDSKRQISLIPDSQILKAQLEETRKLVDLNHDWMKIAKTPAQAREIIRSGKLAIVQGVEMDQMSEMFPGCDSKCEVDKLWNMGVRQVFPIHGSDNQLGGAAVFQDAYNSLTDLLLGYHPEAGIRNSQTEHFMSVKEGCPVPLDSECAVYHLKSPPSRLGIKTIIWFWNIPFPLKAQKKYWPLYGEKNKLGLTPKGKEYIGLLMDKGILVDLAHMSDASIDGVYDLMASRLGPECSGFGRDMNLPRHCFEDAYPIVESHVHFRSLAADSYSENGGTGAVTTSRDFARQEYQLSDRQAEMIRRTSGVAGQFITEYPIKTPKLASGPVPFKNDCGLSSKSFGYSWLYAMEKLGPTAAFATDMTFIPMVSPRFGKDACKGYQLAPDPKLEKRTWIGQYEIGAQKKEIDYNPSHPNSLHPYRIGRPKDKRGHTYDFNDEGLAHYGMIPDMMEDLHNLQLSTQAFTALFNSAEAYIEAWEKAEWLAGGASKPVQ